MRLYKPIVNAALEKITGPGRTAACACNLTHQTKHCASRAAKTRRLCSPKASLHATIDLTRHTHFNYRRFGQPGVLHKRVDDRRQEQGLLPRQGEYSLWRHCSPAIEETGEGFSVEAPLCYHLTSSTGTLLYSFLPISDDLTGHRKHRGEPQRIRTGVSGSTSNVVAAGFESDRCVFEACGRIRISFHNLHYERSRDAIIRIISVIQIR